jgi:mono/diheme cytochrome c family protein
MHMPAARRAAARTTILPRDRSARIAVAVAVLGPALVVSLASRGQAADTNPAAEWREYQRAIQPFFARHCFECHTEKESGDVRLDLFKDEKALANGLPTIEKALAMLRKRAMPPKNRPQPGDDERTPVLAWMEAYVARMDRQQPSAPDRVVIRRLNRAEYNNTVRDLLGVTFRPADDFPPDVPGHGFDTVGGTLSVSPALAEKYLAAAETVARAAVFGVGPLKPERVPHQPFFTADAFSTNKSVKFDYDETGMSLPSALHVVQMFPADGEYTFRGILRGVRPPGSEPVELGFWIDGKLVHEAKVPVPTKVEAGRGPGELNGLWAEFRAPVTAGEHWLSVTLLRMYEGLPLDYKGPKPAKTTARVSRATDAFFPMYLDVVGPYKQREGPSEESLKKVFPGGPAQGPRDAAYARAILANLARRAFRRPVAEKEVDALVKLVTTVQKDGDSFEEGLCLAIERILISPHFLFRVERRPAAGTGEDLYGISQHELATRLSYFLWSSMPDDELLRSADEGTLRQPDVLEAQVRRMLKDPKVHAQVENFGGQWLQTRALESHTPDRAKFPEFTDYTRMSMKRETDLFFENVIREDRPILDFVDAPYTFLNQRLAEYYKIPGVKGHEFRKVDLTETQRRGVLAHASVLTVTSYANRTSPVLRGKWILENLLNTPPPAPPPDVPALNESPIGKSVSVRAQLEEHRANPNCASCHARMDPLGFALENFDAIGAWREKDGNLPIDTSGTLPDGRSFKGFQDLLAILRADPGALTECLADKMLTYALGRGLERSDRKTVKAIVERVAKDDYRFSTLVLEIARSAPFQMKNESRGAR